MRTPGLFICVCTYKRTDLLARLLQDIFNQKKTPEGVIIVDGSPGDGEVKALLKTAGNAFQGSLAYLSSNHANLPYQRFLGWKAADSKKARTLFYFDDDMRLLEPSILGELIKPFDDLEGVVGVTADFSSAGPEKFTKHATLSDQRKMQTGLRHGKNDLMNEWLDRLRKVPPGGLLPSGCRVPLRQERTEKTSEVHWLFGGVMGFSMKALSQECFREEMFALAHILSGRGEDTLLSHLVGARGKMVCVNGLRIVHSDQDNPRAYSTEPTRFGYGAAYSRRLLNDFYRGFECPKISDRVYLLTSYAGNNALNFLKWLSRPSWHRMEYALGYLKGTWDGIFNRPSAKKICPDIDWGFDAGIVLKSMTEIRGDALENSH